MDNGRARCPPWKTYGQWQGGATLDLSRIDRLDSIFEFSRDRLLTVHVNRTARASCRLSDQRRQRVRDAFAGRLMIR